MTRPVIAALCTLLLQSCSSGALDAALTGMCVASEANCIKSCQRDYKTGYSSVSGYDYCAASCTGSGSGCAFTAD